MDQEASEEGWYTDPFGRHEARWMSQGAPTFLVRDGVTEGRDPVVDEPYTVTPTRIVASGPGDGSDLQRADDLERAAPFDQQAAIRAGATVIDTVGFGSPAVYHAQPRNLSLRKQFVPTLIVLALVALAVVAVVVFRHGGPPTTNSACSLLSTDQARTAMKAPYALRSSGTEDRAIGGSACAYLPGGHAVQRSGGRVFSLFVTVRPAPKGFPSALQRQDGTPVAVNGRMAWWIHTAIAVTPVGANVRSGGPHVLTIVDGGREISVEPTTTTHPENAARAAMGDIVHNE